MKLINKYLMKLGKLIRNRYKARGSLDRGAKFPRGEWALRKGEGHTYHPDRYIAPVEDE